MIENTKPATQGAMLAHCKKFQAPAVRFGAFVVDVGR